MTLQIDLYLYCHGVNTPYFSGFATVRQRSGSSVLNGQLFERDTQLTHSVDWYLNHEGFISLIGKLRWQRAYQIPW